ncbi:hypothetical protein ACFWTC_10140 [Streptomyces sp. NPDC058619]|uniref:hypothetical protein n=1 Tax=unclassified Streptomyces TaxID=2593676 RepID=UPI00365706EF
MRTRSVFPAFVAALGLILLAPAPALAHGDTVKVVVTGQREGRVTAAVTWENDGDAVEEAVAATVNAVSVDGTRTLGPFRLIRDPLAPPAGWTTAEALPPGTWKVSVDVGFPALGHGELEVGVPVVDPAPAPSAAGPSAGTAATGATATGTSATTPTAAASPTASSPQSGAPASDAAEPAASGPALWWTTAGVAVTALTGAAAGILLRRRRARRLR